MAVELAVLMPVSIVVALMAYNLASFVCLCAEFDRVAGDAVLSQGVSPTGTQTEVAGVEQVRAAIEESMGGDGRSFEVSAERLSKSQRRGALSVSPLLTRYTCTMRMRPWPSRFVLAGVRFDAPLALVHRHTLVVDRFRPGVVM